MNRTLIFLKVGVKEKKRALEDVDVKKIPLKAEEISRFLYDKTRFHARGGFND